MDVHDLDRESAKLIVDLRLEEIAETLQGNELEAGQAASLRAWRTSLMEQLTDLRYQVR